MTSKYEDNHVVEDHMGDLLILIGHFRDELCWKDSITVYSQLFCQFHVYYGSLSHLIRYFIVNGAPG